MPPTLLTDANGNLCFSSDRAVCVIMDYFFPIDDPTQDTTTHQLIRYCSKQPYVAEDDLYFSQEEIYGIVNGLANRKAPGHDSITSEIAKHIFSIHPDFMVSIYNACLREGKFPDVWKKAICKLIPKPGKRTMDKPNCYRPISLLPVFGKVLEKALINRINHFLHRGRKLNIHQYGFTTPQCSTIDAILHVKQQAQNALLKKVIVC